MQLEQLHGTPGHLIRRCQQIAVSLFLEECGPFDITPIQYAVLAALKARPDIEQIKLAGLAALDRSTTGYVVDRLEARKLVLRKPCAADRRLKRISLTASGEAIVDDIQTAIARTQDRILSPLNPEERALFTDFLTRLANVNNSYSRAPLIMAEKRVSA